MSNKLELLNVIRDKRKSMSKGQKKIADYLLEHYDTAAFLTAAELGKKTKVSESTVVRFATCIGLAGYPELQKKLQCMLQDKIHCVHRIEIAGGRMPQEQVLDNVCKADADKILDTLNLIDRDSFSAAIKLLLTGKNIYIIGLRNCSPLASFLAYYMKLVRPGIILVKSSNINEILEELLHISNQDVLLGISFPKYSFRTLKAMEYANDRNAAIISITDSKYSPMNMYSSCNLFARSDMASVVDSLVAPLSVINALIVAVCLQKHEAVIHNLELLGGVLGNYQIGENDEIDMLDENVLEALKKMSMETIDG